MSTNMGIKTILKKCFKILIVLGILNFAYILMQLIFSKDFENDKLHQENKIYNVEHLAQNKPEILLFPKQFSSNISHSYTTKDYRTSQKPLKDEQKQLDYISKYLDIEVLPGENSGGYFSFNVELLNTGDEHIPGCCWSIYLYTTKFLDSVKVVKGMKGLEIQVLHVVGYTYKLTFTSLDFSIAPNVVIIIQIRGSGWMMNKSDFIPNWYVACDTCHDTLPKLILSTRDHENDSIYSNNDTYNNLGIPFIHDFPKLNVRYGSDKFMPFTPYLRFKNNAFEKEEVVPYAITPKPFIISNFLTSNQDHLDQIQLREFNFGKWKIACPPDFENEAKYLKNQLRIKYPIRFDVKQSSQHVIFLLKSDEVARVMELNLQHLNNDTLHDPSSVYRLIISKDYIVVKAAHDVGIFYGIISLLQLVQNDKFRSQSGPKKDENEITLNNTEMRATIRLPKIDIIDGARFNYRGLMIDVSRNFQSIESLKKVVEMLALYKMNVLHLHLADDEAWRLEIPGLPELVKVGACRGHDPNEKECLMSMLGYKPTNDSNAKVTQYYSVKDFQDLLDHATAHHVKVIPEFDMPSHSHAALVAMRARFKKYKRMKKNKKAVEYLLHDLDDKSQYMTGQYYTFSAINPCIQSTYNFVKKVFQEVINIYKDHNPLTHIHLGGDEVSVNAFTDSPLCDGLKMKLSRKLGRSATTHDIKVFFVRRVVNVAKKFNLSIIGWQDAFDNNDGSYAGFDKGQTEVVSQFYYNSWEGGYGNVGNLLANKGMKVIMSPVTNLYLDNPQEPNSDEPGLHWAARYLDTKRVFSFTPRNIFNSIKNDIRGNKLNKTELCAKMTCMLLKKPENIIGMEGALWSELVRTRSRMDMMLFPRLLAVAERSWHRAMWEHLDSEKVVSTKMNNDWREFASRVGAYELKRLEEHKIKYYIPKPGAFIKNGKLRVNTMFPGLRVKMKKGKISAEGKWVEVFDGQPLGTMNLYKGITLVTESYDGQRKSYPVYLKSKRQSTPASSFAN